MVSISAIRDGLAWRGRLLQAKCRGRIGTVPWHILAREVTHRRELRYEFPNVDVLDEDERAELRLIGVAGERYWIPSEFDPETLKGIFKEVFYPEHPSHYEYDHCHIRPGDVVVDAGACEGFFVRFALQRRARVLAIEAWSKMAEALRRTYAEEIVRGEVVVAQVLLGDGAGQARFVVDPHWPQGASVWLDDTGDRLSETVPAATLDQLIATSPWDGCDFIKMDIEGSEQAALAGALRTIRTHRPRLSIAAYHWPGDYMAVARTIRSLQLGYRVTGKGLLDQGLAIDHTWRPVVLHAWAPRGVARPRVEGL